MLSNSEDTVSKLTQSILDMESFLDTITKDSMVFNIF